MRSAPALWRRRQSGTTRHVDDASREAERAALTAPADAEVLTRLAVARARSGDLPGAHAAALAALGVDRSAPVRDYVRAPAPPSMLDVNLAAEPAPVPVPSPPFRIEPLVGPPLAEPFLTGDSVVDVGRGLVAYASPDGLVAVDTFGGGVAWRSTHAVPWGVHRGRLLAKRRLSGFGRGSVLLNLDPATGKVVAPPTWPRDLGLAQDALLSPIAIDERTLAVLGTSPPPNDRVARVALVGPEGIRSVEVPAPDADRGAFAFGGVLAYQTTAPVATSYRSENMIVALADGQVAWTSPDDLLGVVDGCFALLAWPQTGPVVRLVRPDDGSVADEFPVRTEVAGGIHAFRDAVVTSSSETRQFGLDRAWRQRWSWAPDSLDHDVCVRAFADLLLVTIDIRDGFMSNGDPPRRALAILALDPRSGSVVWRQDLEPPVHMAADPVPVAGGLVLPGWRAPPVVVRAAGPDTAVG